jgi:hypothetical protein
MSSSFFWTLVTLSFVMIMAGVGVRQWQRDVGFAMALLGLVLGLFTLGFAAGPFLAA